MRRAVLIIVGVVLAIGIYESARHSSRVARSGSAQGIVHSVAPGFSLQDLEGHPLDLANYRGDVVLLNFWATWCAPCRDETPHFVELQDKYRAQGLQVIGISMDDSRKPVIEFYQKFKMNYPVAVGSADLAESYGGVLGLPITFLIGRDGRVAAKYAGAVEAPVLEEEINSLLRVK